MRERKRLRLIQRQLLLAQQARREAMGGLADSLAEEERSADLTRRAQALALAYAPQCATTSAQDLRQQAAFAQSLAQLARQSDAARRDAGDQAMWQARALAAAEHRAKGLEERAASARRAIVAQGERREREHSAMMARKLQTQAGHPSSPAQSRNGLSRKGLDLDPDPA